MSACIGRPTLRKPMVTTTLRNVSLVCLLFVSSHLVSETWAPPITISDPAFSATVTGIPPIGVDGAGNAIAIWVSQESTTSVVRSSRFSSVTKTWSSPVEIGSDGANDAHIAVTADGKAVAVWSNSSSSVSTTYANVFDGSDWLGEYIIDTDSEYQTQFYPRVAVDDFGRGYVLWQVQGGNLARVIRSSTYYFDTNSWSSVVNISTDYGEGNQYLALPAIAVNQSGSAVATWIYQDITTQIHKVQANRYSGGEWLASGSEETILTSSANTTQFAAPAVAVAPNGNALVLFASYDATMSPIQNYSISSTVFNLATLSWSSTVQVSPVGVADISKIFLDVACDGSGDAIAVWLMRDETTPPGTSVVQTTAFPNLSWSTTVSTISDSDLLAYICRVALDASGEGYAIWTATDNSTFMNIQVAKYAKNSDSWQSPITISDSGIFATGPNQISGISSNAAGDFFGIWSHVDASTSIVSIQSSDVSVEPLPPANFLGIVLTYDVLNSTQYVLESAWDPSPSDNIIFYRLYKNNVLFAEVSADDPLLYVKMSCDSDTFSDYSVAAVNSRNLESSRIPLTIRAH